MKEDILVSIMAFSYNSENYIIDLLESIKAQTYQNIEFILSDDASTDQTVALAEAWIAENKERFVRTCIRKSEKNQGPTKNVNEGFKLCRGTYIKQLAADDKFAPDCVEVMLKACEEHQYQVLFGCMQSFGRDGKLLDMPINKDFFELSAKEQYQHLLEVNDAQAPTAFFRRSFLEEMHYYEEQYPFMEDYPFWLRTTKAGIPLRLCDYVVVHYRRNEESLTSTTNEKVVGKNYFKTYKKFFYRKKFFPLIRYKKIRILCREIKEFIYKDLILLFGNKRNSKATSTLHKLFYS